MFRSWPPLSKLNWFKWDFIQIFSTRCEPDINLLKIWFYEVCCEQCYKVEVAQPALKLCYFRTVKVLVPIYTQMSIQRTLTEKLVYRLTGLDLTIQENMLLFAWTATSKYKPVKQETSCTMILPLWLVISGQSHDICLLHWHNKAQMKFVWLISLFFEQRTYILKGEILWKVGKTIFAVMHTLDKEQIFQK